MTHPYAVRADPEATPRRGVGTPLLVGGLVAAATTYVALADPNTPGHFPGCPFKAVTGLDCPGCGGLRSVHAYTRGHLTQALDQNLLVAVLLPLAVVAWVVWLWRSWRGRRARPVPSRTWIVVGVVVLVFAVVRNLPFAEVLASGLR